MKIRLALAAVALASPALLAGCSIGSDQPSATDDVSVGSNADNTEAEDASVDDEAVDEGGEAVFGDSLTWGDGVQVTVSEPKTFKLKDDWLMSESWDHYVEYEVTVVNGSDARYDASMMSFFVQSGNADAEEVFDSEQGFNGTPSTTLLAGREAKFKIGFGVKDPKDQVMEISSSNWDHANMIFTN